MSTFRTIIESDRFKSLSKSSIAIGVASITKMVVSFVTVPLVLGYLGTEKYGLWVAIVSMVVILTSLFEGGIANGLITGAAKAQAKGGAYAVSEQISSALALMGLIAVSLIVIAFITVPTISWHWVFNLTDLGLAETAQTTILIVFTCLVFSFLANIVLKARIGLQEISAVSWWNMVAYIATLPAIWFVIHLKLGMGWLAVALMGVPVAVKTIGSIQYLFFHPELMPRVKMVNLKVAKNVVGGGAVIFVIALSQAIAVQSDQVLIAKFADLEDVATYSVVQKLFTIPFIVANFLFLALWPAIASAAEKKQYDWVKRTFKTALAITVMFALAIAGILFIFQSGLLNLWVGNKIQPSIEMVSLFAVYALLMVIVGCCSTFLIALDTRKPQILISLSMMVINLPLSIFLISKLGSVGAILGTCIAYFVCMLIPYAVIIPRLYRNKLATVTENNGS